MGDQNLGVYPASPGTNSCPTCGSINLGLPKVCSLCGAHLPDVTASLGPGEIIHGKYEVLSLLGVGGMGEVYKVRHLTLDAIRCIKLMKKGLMEDETFQSRFIREAKVATRVQHPNVAVVHDFDQAEDGSFYLVSEYIDGITLRQWSKRHGRFPIDLAIALVLQVLSGLHHIHSQGLLHRDVSGDNIMLTVDHDEDPVAKIIDLGIAKVIEGAADHTHATQVGMFVGNPKYSSPEQLGMLGEDETIDARADLYCLGVVLYEMVLGTPPFVSRTAHGYVAKHLTEKPPRFATIDPDFESPGGFEDVVIKALEKNREQRYANARMFSKALRPFLKEFDTDLSVYGESLSADLPSHQAAALLREVTPLPQTSPTNELGAAGSIPDTEQRPLTSAEDIERRERDRFAWEQADGESTLDSYRAYLNAYPTGAFAEHARSRIDELETLDRITSLEEDGDVESLRSMASAHSRHTVIGRTSREAIERIESRADAARLELENRAWREADELDTPDSWRTYLEHHSSSPRSSEAKGRLENALNRHAENAWNEATEQGTSAAWMAFIESYPGFPGISEARTRLAEAGDFEKASKVNTIPSWREFLSRWRYGTHVDVARSRLEALETEEINRRYEEAMTRRSVDLLQRFLAEYPSAGQATLARTALDEELAFVELRNDPSEQALKSFLGRFPDSRHAGEVTNRLAAIQEEAAFERARLEATSSALQRFLAEHGNSRFVTEAKKHLAEVHAYESAQNDAEALRSLIDTKPTEILANRARKRLEELQRQAATQEAEEWNRAREEDTASAIELFLTRHPQGGHAEEARQLLSEIHGFREAQATDTIAAWSKFLDSRPSSARAKIAKQRSEALRREDADWKVADSAGTVAGWKRFLDRHPGSRLAIEATSRLEEAAAFEKAMKSNRIAAWEKFAQEWSTGPHAADARERLERLRSYESLPDEPAPTIIQHIEPPPDTGGTAAWRPEEAVPTPRTLVSQPQPVAEVATIAPRATGTLAERSDLRTASPPKAKSLFVIAIVALVAALSIALFILMRPSDDLETERPSEKPTTWTASGTPNLTIDAIPWARVTSVADMNGNNMIKKEEPTPLGVEVPPGTYVVTLASGSDSRQLKVEVQPESVSVVSETFAEVDARRFFEEMGWK